MSELDYRDPKVFAEWLESQRAKVLLLLESKVSAPLRRKVDLEDLFQEAASRAYQSLEGANFPTGNPMTWFLQILDHQIVDAYRYHFAAQKRDASREVSGSLPSNASSGDLSPEWIDLLVASMTSPSQAFSRHVKLNRMHQALENLPPEAKQAIRWRYLENLPSQEIAVRLGKSDGAVRVLLTRTLKKLQELLSDGQ